MQGGGTNSLRKLRRDWWKTRLCTSCVSPLGRIISRGGVCPQCGLRVCKKCRCELDSETGAWVCVLCSTSGGLDSDILVKGSTKSLGRDSRSIRRSWTISNPQRAQTNSPVLKSYTILAPEESLGPSGSSSGVISSSQPGGGTSHPSTSSSRQFHSLPRMSTETERTKKIKRSFETEFDKERIKRHRSFQTTLHPYQVANPPSPSASINFIEDPFWDYYDYDIEEGSSPSGSPRTTVVSRILRLTPRDSLLRMSSRRNYSNSIRRTHQAHHEQVTEMEKLLNMRSHTHSNRSSCERSLGETFDYDFCVKNYSNYNSLSDTELNEIGSKFDEHNQPSPSEEFLVPRRFSTESSNFYRFATVTPINLSPINDPRKDSSAPTTTTSFISSPNGFSTRSRNLQLLNDRRNLNTPTKPERKGHKNRRSMSLNSYDGKKLFSPLRTYVVLMKENLVPKPNNISNPHERNSSCVNHEDSFMTRANSGEETLVDASTASLKKTNGNVVGTSKTPSHRKNNTSSVLINSSDSIQHLGDVYGQNSVTKFHSLPRERVIRIERDGDWRATSTQKPGRTFEDLKLNKNKSTIVEISSSPKNILPRSSLDDFGVSGRNLFNNKNKIERSQSHREISVSKPLLLSPPINSSGLYSSDHHDDENNKSRFPLRTQARREKNSIPASNVVLSGTSTLPLIRRTKGKMTSGADDGGNFSGKTIGNNISSQKSSSPFTESSFLLDDKESMNLVQNFLRTHHQSTSSPILVDGTRSVSSNGPGGGSGGSGSTINNIANISSSVGSGSASSSSGVNRTPNEKATPKRESSDLKLPAGQMIKDSSKPSDFVQEQMNDFHHFQRQQIRTFDNYLKQSSTFPRTLHKSTDSTRVSQEEGLTASASSNSNTNTAHARKRLDSEPVRKHTSTTTINSSSDNTNKTLGKHYDSLDAYFHPTTEAGDQSTNNERIVPIVVVNGVSHPASGWSATLPHPYVRKHRQQRATFLEQQEKDQEVPVDNKNKAAARVSTNSKPSPTISDIEREIERDIYFQKTQSLDRSRSAHQKKFQSTSVYFNPVEVHMTEGSVEDTKSRGNNEPSPPPVASPRLKRKAKLLQASTPNLTTTTASSSSNTTSGFSYSNPKINTEQSSSPLGQEYVSREMGPNYRPSFPNAYKNIPNPSRLPNEPRPMLTESSVKDLPSGSSSSLQQHLKENQSTDRYTRGSSFDPQISQLSPKNRKPGENSSGFCDARHDTLTPMSGFPSSESELPSRSSLNKSCCSSEVSINQSIQQVPPEPSSSAAAAPVPVATPRTKRKNSFQKHSTDETDSCGKMNQPTLLLEGESSSSVMKSGPLNPPKAVRFEPHVIEMELENERKHNEARINTTNLGISHGMRAHKHFTNKLQGRSNSEDAEELVGYEYESQSPVIGGSVDNNTSASNTTPSSAQQLAYMKSRGNKSHTYYFAGNSPATRRLHHQHQHGGAKNSKHSGGNPDKDKRSRGFVARAIAKVKSKAIKGTSNKPLNKSHVINQNNVRSVETRDSITYISPPATHAEKEQIIASAQLNQQVSSSTPLSLQDKHNQQNVIINPQPVILSDESGSHHQIVGRVESFSKGILKHESSKTKDQLLQNQTISSPVISNSQATPPKKPKRKPHIKMESLGSSSTPANSKSSSSTAKPITVRTSKKDSSSPMGTSSSTISGQPEQFPGLEIDQITPSSSSSSSSSYLSNLQESYDFFHDSEECESIGADDEQEDIEEDLSPESDCVFKSFDDDEDAGEDFIFYSNQLSPSPDSNDGGGNNEERKSRVSHAYNGPGIIHRANSFNNSAPDKTHQQGSLNVHHVNNNNTRDYHKKGDKSKTKGLAAAAAATPSLSQVEDNRKDISQPHHLNLSRVVETQEGVVPKDNFCKNTLTSHSVENTSDAGLAVSRLSDPTSGKTAIVEELQQAEESYKTNNDKTKKTHHQDDYYKYNYNNNDDTGATTDDAGGYEGTPHSNIGGGGDGRLHTTKNNTPAIPHSSKSTNKKSVEESPAAIKSPRNNCTNNQWDNFIESRDEHGAPNKSSSPTTEQSQKAYGTNSIVTKPQQSQIKNTNQSNSIISGSGDLHREDQNSFNNSQFKKNSFKNLPKKISSNKNNNLLLPSSFYKSPFLTTTNDPFVKSGATSSSEFFPGGGGVISPPEGSPPTNTNTPSGSSSMSTFDNSEALVLDPGRKFKSRVLVNPEAEVEVPSGSSPPPQLAKKNVTRVEISGDVGIVTNASAFLNSRRAQLKKVNNEGLWKNDPDNHSCVSSGLTQLSKSFDDCEDGESGGRIAGGGDDNLSLKQRQRQSDEDNASTISASACGEGEDEILGGEEGVGGSPQGSGSGSETSSCKVGSSSEEDGSSDWHSESTKNTVIFRGKKEWSPPKSEEELLMGSHSSSFPYNCDPEIHISSITLVDRSENGSSGSTVTSPSVSPTSEVSHHPHPPSCAIAGGSVDPSKEKLTTNQQLLKSHESLDDKGECVSSAELIEDNNKGAARSNCGSASHSEIGSDRTSASRDHNSISSSEGTPSSVVALVDSSEELSKSNETLTDLDLLEDQVEPIVQMPEDLEEEERRHVSKKSSTNNKAFHQRRESPEGQEQEVPTPHPDENKDSSSVSSMGSDVSSNKTCAASGKNVLGLHEVVILEEKCSSSPPGSSSSSSPPQKKAISKSKISQAALLSQLNPSSSRSSPDGQDAERSSDGGDSTTTEPDVDSPTPMIEQFDVTSDDDSWVEEIIFEDDDEPNVNVKSCRPVQPPPLDLTLHTIVEESCEESEAESTSGNFNEDPLHNNGGGSSTSRNAHGRKLLYSTSKQQNDSELEKYFNFGIYGSGSGSGSGGGGNGGSFFSGGGGDSSEGRNNSFTNDESEFSDTFSESSFSIHDDNELGGGGGGGGTAEGSLEESPTNNRNGTRRSANDERPIDPAELASSRLEKYFFNLGLPQSMINPISSINQAADSDSVGSESESDNSVLENRKKVLKHHRRSADFEDEFGDKVSDEEEDFGFGQDGFDTIKKTSRKVKKSGSEGNLLDSSLSNSGTTSSASPGGPGGSQSSENLSTPTGGSTSSPGRGEGPTQELIGGLSPEIISATLKSSSSNNTSTSTSSHAKGELTSKKDKLSLQPQLSNGGTSSSKEESGSSASPTSPPSSSRKLGKAGEKPVIKVNRSNSFTWSSDEEVNIMMSKLRALIKNLIKSKTESNANNATRTSMNVAATDSLSSTNPDVSNASNINTKDKDKQLAYLESELIRLMKTENLKNIVEYFSSEESDVDDVYKFIKVVKDKEGGVGGSRGGLNDLALDLQRNPHLLVKSLQSKMSQEEREEDDDDEDGSSSSSQLTPTGSPALLAKVMHHIGNRLAVWMKDENAPEDDNNDDNVTLKCAQSVSSDLNEDRFSWKGSFESALAAKRQSVGSTDSISSSDFTQDRSILRSSSLHHLANSSHHLGQVEENKEEEETASSLPRMTNLCNSLPRLNQPSNLAISRAHSLVMSSGRLSSGDGDQVQQQQLHHSHSHHQHHQLPSGSIGPIKSARYRPPGFQPVKSKRIDDDGTSSPTATLSQSTPVLTQDPGNLKVRSDSMGSIFHETKPQICVKGQVEFGLQYNYKLACLEVRVKQCRDLASVDCKRNRSDPYVKAYLLPDRSKGGKRKTKIKKNTLSPMFEEVLKFPLTLSELQNRTLWLSVWNSDTFGKNEFLGEVLVELKDRVFDDPNPQWWDLQEQSGQTEDMPRGDVVIALKWQPKTENTGNLSVLVKEAKNLAPVKNGSPSTFIKCMMLSDKSRKHKTSISRRSYNPVWNQTLNFEEVEDDGIELTLWNHDLLSHHDLLGTIRIDFDNHLWESMLSRHSFWVEGVLRLT